MIIDASVIPQLFEENPQWKITRDANHNRETEKAAKILPYLKSFVKDLRVHNRCLYMDHSLYIAEPLQRALLKKILATNCGQA